MRTLSVRQVTMYSGAFSSSSSSSSTGACSPRPLSRCPAASPLFSRSLELRQGSPFHPFVSIDGSSRRKLRAETHAPDTSRSLSIRFVGTLGSVGAVPADLCVSCAFQKPPRSLVFYGIAVRLLLVFYHPHPSMSLRVYWARLRCFLHSRNRPMESSFCSANKRGAI